MTQSLRLISVDWIDSKGVTGEWEFADDLEPLEPSRCTSVGFLLEETKEYKTLAQTISQEQVLGRITIPVQAILKQRRLK